MKPLCICIPRGPGIPLLASLGILSGLVVSAYGVKEAGVPSVPAPPAETDPIGLLKSFPRPGGTPQGGIAGQVSFYTTSFDSGEG